MSQVAPAIIEARWGEHRECYPVQYNPKEFSLEKNLQHGEITIPGLDAPLQQFIRGQAEKLTVELFFDTTEKGLGKGARSVTEETDRIYKLTKIEHTTHAPAIVTFCWNTKFPGADISRGDDNNCRGNQAAGTSGNSGGSSGNQTRNAFVGVVESVRQQFTLFSSEGIPLRATVNLVLKEYRSLEDQLNQMRLNSPDKTHSHVLSDGETLSNLAGNYYDDTRRWRYIARENDIVDPRRINAGALLQVPAISNR